MSDRLHDVVNHLDKLRRTVFSDCLGLVLSVSPLSGNIDLYKCSEAGVDCLVVHVNDFLTLLEEGFCRRVLHILDGLVLGKNVRQSKEGGLKNCVCSLAQTYLRGKIDSVDGIELNIVLGNVSLCLSVELLSKLCLIPLAVDEEYAAGLNVVDHLVALLDIRGVMAGDKVSLVDVIGTLYRAVAETKVGDGDTARLL